MTAVWTAMSLQRRDVASNSLSRSLGSLMMPPADDSVDDEEEDEEAEKEQQRGATVILHTNMATTDPSSSIQDPQSRWSVDSETQSSAPFVRQVSAPTPQFQKLVTNSASSITFLGKRITREYQSHFVLPDKQLVAVVRKETFLPEEAQSEVTLSLSVAAPPEISDTTRIGDTCRMKKRICDYLDPDDWASAILASSESRDAELLGRLGSKYSSSVTRRSRLERSTSRKSRKEIVLARELYSDDDDDEEEAADVHMSSDDEDARSKLRSPAPAQPDRAYPSPNYPISRPSERVGTVKKTPPPTPPSSKFTPRSASPKSALTTPPIAAAYAETPGTRVKPLSDVRSRLNFEELRRKWDERVAREQMHLDEQVEQSRGSEQPPTVGYHPDGHRGSAVTSILPIHRKSKSRDQHELAGDANEGMAEHGRSPTQRYLANRTNTLSDPAYKPGSPRPGPIADYGTELYPQSPLSAQSEPVIDREEKDAKFSYNHEKLRIGQENIDRMNPTVQGPRTSTVEGKRRESYSEQEQFDRYSPELPAVPPRFRDSATTDPTGKPGSTATRPMLPPKPSPGDYRSARKAGHLIAPHTRPERLADQYNRQDLNVRPTPPPASPRLDAEHQRLPESRPAQRPRESRDLEDDRAGANARTKYGEADAGRVQPNGQYGRKRHPPPPASPPIRHGGRQIATGADSAGASETHSSQRRPPPVADPERAEPSVERSGSRTPSYHEVLGGVGASGGGGGGRHHSHRSKPVGGSHTRNGHRPGPDNLVPWHPDEYNLQDEAHRAKHTTKGAREPDVYGATIPGELRKRPTSHTHDHKRTDRSSRHSTSVADKETKPSGHKPRHPSPPKPPAQRPEPKTNDRVHRSKRGHPESQSINQDMDSPYMNLPGSIPYGAKPLAEDVMKKSPPEYSDRSNEHSSYDPRVGDLADLSGHSRRPAQPAPPQPTPSGPTSIGREKHAPKASPRTQTLESDHQRGKSASRGQPGVVAQATHPRRAAQDDLFDSEDDDDDLDDSDGDEELKPPPLRISQTKQSSESLARSKKHSGGTPSGQPRTSTRISHHKPRSSPRGSLLSPGAMSAPSTQGYFAPGSLDKSHRSGHYRPEQFHSHQYEQISQDRASRPRSRRTTATSQEVVDPRAVSGSKHSLIISTKRRTLSGVTGTNPVKQRSSSMNALWFGDHPVPSSGALSPNAPFRLSAIQLQAQAELERRYRSSSRAHSLDRRSGLSHYGFGTESHLSRAPTEIEGYDGVGYGYDTRGRLIHGGAPLQERAISRKRRLQDGHESLSRVWIPQSETTQRTLRSGDPSPSAATRLTERKANLDESAVAFALRDFTAPGSVRLWESGVDTDLSSASEHIYARPSSLLHSSELGTRLGSKARSKQLRDYSQGAVGAVLNRDSRFYSTRSLYQNDAFPLVRLRRPRLVPNRWGSVPLPDSKQYDSLIRLSTHSITSRPSSTDPTKYMLESNV